MNMSKPKLRARLEAAATAFRAPSLLDPAPPTNAHISPPEQPLIISPPFSLSELSHILRRRLYTSTLPDTIHLVLAEHVRHVLTITFSLAACLHLLETEAVDKFRHSKSFRRIRIVSFLQLPFLRSIFFPVFRHAPVLLWILEPFRFLAVPFAIDGLVRFGVSEVQKRLPGAQTKSELEQFSVHVKEVLHGVGERVDEVVDGVKKGMEEVFEEVTSGVQRDVERIKKGVEKFIEGTHEGNGMEKIELPDTNEESVVEMNEKRVKSNKNEWRPFRGRGSGDLTP